MKSLYFFLFLLLYSQHLIAQNKGMVPIGNQLPAGTERRLALVIGNKYYAHAARLNNTHNDADDMAKVLQNLGFDVILKKDLSMIDFLKSIDDFGTKLGQYNVGLLYYSGHGIQYQGENYLVPIDAKPNTVEDIEYTCVKLGRAMAKMEGAKLKVSLAFLDACRNNPFPSSSRAVGQGLTMPNNPPGSFVVFSTRAGSTADDNSSGRNGLFTSALLQNLSQANVGLRTMIDNTIKQVGTQSNKAQIPGRYDELTGDFYFLVSSADKPNPTPEVVKKEEPAPVRSTPKKDLLPYEPEMVFVRGGTFGMGSNDGGSDEKPLHRVRLEDFFIGKFEVTVKEYLAFCSATKGHYPEWLETGSQYHIDTGKDTFYKSKGYNRSSERLPIVGISWHDAVAYCQWLSSQTGKTYRLPTEAEWEFAARGGKDNNVNTFAGSNTAGSVGWNDNNSEGKPHKVGGKQANELGLYDMSGNVWEWCSDWYNESYYKNSVDYNPTGPKDGTLKVLRGGSCGSNAQDSRVSNRNFNNLMLRGSGYGFRVAIEP